MTMTITCRALAQSDDPMASIARADLLEEQGEDIEARRWRLYGEWHQAIADAIGSLPDVPTIPLKYCGTVVRLPNRLVCHVRVSPAQAYIAVTHLDRKGILPHLGERPLTVAWAYFARQLLDRPCYLRNRVRLLVDEYLRQEKTWL